MHELFEKMKTSHGSTEEKAKNSNDSNPTSEQNVISSTSKLRKSSGGEQSLGNHSISPSSKILTKNRKNSSGEQVSEHSIAYSPKYQSHISSPRSDDDKKGIDPYFLSSSKAHRRSDIRTLDSLESPIRRSSPRLFLKKSSKDKREQDSLSESNHIIEEKESIASITTESPQIINIPDKLYSFSSSEQDNELKQFYKLNLKEIIAERDDPCFQRHVNPYFDETLQIKIKPGATKSRLTFEEYFPYIIEELNAIQRTKFSLISFLVDLLNIGYCKHKQTEYNHKKFCNQLNNVVEYCMNTSEASCERSKYHPNSIQAPGTKISRFWETAFLINGPIGTEEYSITLKKLLSAVHRSFLMSENLHYLKDFDCKRSDKGNPFSCISWDYFDVLCDACFIIGNALEQFKSSYNANLSGLAVKFIYVPDMWDFLRNIMDNNGIKNTNYHEMLKRIDYLLLHTTAFENFEPESKSTLRKSVLSIF